MRFEVGDYVVGRKLSRAIWRVVELDVGPSWMNEAKIRVELVWLSPDALVWWEKGAQRNVLYRDMEQANEMLVIALAADDRDHSEPKW